VLVVLVNPGIEKVTTKVDTYADVFIWNTHDLIGEIFLFSGATNDLYVKVLASLDGSSYTITAIPEFKVVASATAVEQRILRWYPFIKVQVKPVTAGNHGTLTTTAVGTNKVIETETRMKGFKVSASFTRPANVTAYTALDAMTDSAEAPTVMSFDMSPFGVSPGDFVVVTNMVVVSSVKGRGLNVALHLYPTTFAATNDNSELSIDDATAALGGRVIPSDTFFTTALNGRAVSLPGWWEIMMTSQTLYGTLQAIAGYTPVSREVFTVILDGFII